MPLFCDIKAAEQTSIRSTLCGALAIALLVASLCAALAGCGSGSAASPGPTPTPTPLPTPTPNPAPGVGSISPTSAPAGALAFTLTVNGSNFVPASTVQWDGSSRATTFVSSSQLKASIGAADLSAAGKVSVRVVNPAPGGGTSGASTFTIAPDTIAFTSTRAFDGSNFPDTNIIENIWVMNPDGSAAKALDGLIASTPFRAHSAAPVWSPDGSRIAFVSERALDFNDAGIASLNIWTMNPDGSGLTPLTKLTAGASTTGLAVSPDGSKIAFSSNRALDGSDAVSTNLTSNVWVMNADGSGATPLTKLTAVNTDSGGAVWSADGGKIFFFSSRALDGSDAINTNITGNFWVMNADGSSATPLTKLTAFGVRTSPLAVSPDGNKIAFFSNRALDGSDSSTLISNLWVMKADGSGATPLTSLTTPDAGGLSQVWSPDGSKIAFSSDRALDGSDALNTNQTLNIWVINADGSSATPLTKLTAINALSLGPVWSPGGDKIFFFSFGALDGSDSRNAASNIWVVNADGTGATPLTKLTAANADSFGPRQP